MKDSLNTDIYQSWPYKVEDNFLSDDLFASVLQFSKQYKKSLNIDANKVYSSSNKIYSDGRIVSSTLPSKLIEMLNKECHQKMIGYLENFCPKKIPLYNYSDFQIVLTGKNYSFPVHQDVPIKLLSCVVYIAPEKNTGTKIHSNKAGSNESEIKWQQNRALLFSRKENSTWHSYNGDGISTRTALIYNLCTLNRKMAYKAEGAIMSYYKELYTHNIRRIKNTVRPFFK